MIGRVVSAKLTKTATVLVERQARHPLYKKTFIRSKRYLVEDLIGTKEGDVVEIAKTRPISKMKHWKIAKVLGKNLAEIAKEQMKEKAEQVIAEVMSEEKETEESSDVSHQTEKEVKNEPRKSKVRKEKSES